MHPVIRAAARAACLGLLAAFGIAPPPAAAQRDEVFVADKEACFGRSYDAAHLARHPQQKVTSLHVWRSLGGRPDAEYWKSGDRADAIASYRDDKTANVDAYVTFRDRKGLFHNSLSCRIDDAGRTRCGIDCDGGQFTLSREGDNAVILRNEGFVLVGGCSSDDEDEEKKSVYFSPGADDRTFRLDRQDVKACQALEQQTRPIRIGEGKPLRERFKPDEPFCYGRDYDAAHLAKNPQQKVAAIRVARLDPGKERPKEHGVTQTEWPYDIRLSVSLTLRGGRAAPVTRFQCDPREASFECYTDTTVKSDESCLPTTFHLVRAPGNDIVLINRTDGLPIETACHPKPGKDGGEPPRRVTKSDDRSFRLSPMPVNACR